MFPSKVVLVDVGPRDGLQNEKEPVATPAKVELVHRLQDAGLREIEVTSYVSPKWVPQMADNSAVMEAMKMEHTIAAPRDGTVAELLYGVGDQVAEGGELLRLSAG